ncbi:MAG: hypothetical protein F9K44_15615 [Hyphomicrobiaceae bacterium]|nr:MAG: hypothetical protein F9K44_15615 [Hyphomicrobiaceae bacterium]
MTSPFDPFALWQAWFEACARFQQSALRSMQGGFQGTPAIPLGMWNPFAPVASFVPFGAVPFGQSPFLTWAAPFWAAQSPWSWMPTTFAATMAWPFGPSLTSPGYCNPAANGIGAAFRLAEDAFGMAAQAKIPAALDPWGLMRVSFAAWGQLAGRPF